MAANKIVNVLAINGRRQTVKVTPNTTILQILEEVCAKQGLQPNDYDIIHHRTVLDMSTTIRFSGIPNNGQLELQAATKLRSESDVTLVVQTEDGKRAMGDFSPGSNVWDVLQQLCPSEVSAGDNNNVVVIYMRMEIYGETTMRSTTLRSLGLISGRALMRLIHRSPDSLKTQANVSTPLPQKPVEEKPYIRTFKPLEDPPAQYQARSVAPNDNPASPMDTSNNDGEADTKYKKPIPDAPPARCTAKELEPKAKPHADKKQTASSSGTARAAQSAPILNESESKEDFVFLDARNAMIFSLELAQQIRQEDLPDDFYDVTVEDAKKLLSDLKRRRYELENGKLLTASLRTLDDNRRKLQQLHQYQKAVIRVQFPDRTVLQGCFTPLETIDTVLTFVRTYLHNEQDKFYLFTTPPKVVLPGTARLLELGLVPGALLHYGSDQVFDFYLKRDLLNKMTSPSSASKAATKVRQSSSRPLIPGRTIEPMDIPADADEPIAGPSHFEDYEAKPRAEKPPEKVPKWFKPPSK